MKSLFWKFCWLSCHARAPQSVLPSLCSLWQPDITPAILLEKMTSWALQIYFKATKSPQIYFVFNPLLFTRGCHGSSCYIPWRTHPQGQQSFPWRTAKCDTAELCLSAPVSSQAPSWGGKFPTPTQQVIFLCKSGLFCLHLHFSSLLSLFSLGKQQISGRFFTWISSPKVRQTLAWFWSGLPLHLEGDAS